MHSTRFAATSTRHTAALAAFLLVLDVAAAAGSPQTPAPAAAGAILAGQAIDAVTGAPVANTLIGLSQRAGSGPNTVPTAPKTQLVTVMADANGRFVFRDVPKGSFLLLATAPGYIVSNYGQARAAGPTRTIDLTGTERLVDLKVKLWRHAVISGVVTDEAGEPVVGATVRVLRRMANGPGGERRFQPGTETVTDDRGAYRLTALTPGQFVVAVPQTQVTLQASIVDTYLQSAANRSARADASALLDVMTSSSAVPSAGGGLRVDDLLLQSLGNSRQLTVPPPSAARLLVYRTTIAGDEALIGVGPGEERSGINIQLTPAPGVRVKGRVTADGEGVPNLAVRLIAVGGPALQNEQSFESALAITSQDGSFTLLGVTPGRYILKAIKAPRLVLPPSLASNPAAAAAYLQPPQQTVDAAPAIGAQVSIDVGETDVSDLTVPLRSGATVSGQLVFGIGAPTPQQLRAIGVLLTSEDGGLPGAGLQVVRPSATGTFTIIAPAPGRYMLTTLAPPAGWKLAGSDVDGKPQTGALDLSGDDVVNVTLTFTDELAELTGTARRSDGAPLSTAGIVVFPTDRSRWIQEPLNFRQPRLEQTSTGGAFRMPGLLPGEYFVAAIDDADMPDLADQPFFEKVAAFATRVTLSAKQTGVQQLVMRSVR